MRPRKLFVETLRARTNNTKSVYSSADATLRAAFGIAFLENCRAHQTLHNFLGDATKLAHPHGRGGGRRKKDKEGDVLREIKRGTEDRH